VRSQSSALFLYSTAGCLLWMSAVCSLRASADSRVPAPVVQATDAALAAVRESKTPVSKRLEHTLALPRGGQPLLPTDPTQSKRIMGYLDPIKRGWGIWASNTLSEVAANLVPLAEKVGNADCFGAAYQGSLGTGYVRLTYKFCFISLIPSEAALQSVPSSALKEYTDAEAAALNPLEKAKLRVTHADLSEPLRPDEQREYMQATQFAAGSIVATPALRTLSEQQAKLRDRALATVYLILKDPFPTRAHWTFYAAGPALLGETLIAFPADVSCGTAGACRVETANLLRFFATGDLVAISLSRLPDVFASDFLPSTSGHYPADWFQKDYS